MNQISHPDSFFPAVAACGKPDTLSAVHELPPRGAIWLAALGAAARAGVTQDDICRIVQYLAQPDWEVSGALIEEAVYDLVGDAHLTPQAPPSGEPRFVPTTSGGALFKQLMMTRIAHVPSPLGQACLRIKLGFIDMLPVRDRSQMLEAIARNYERELILRRNRRQPFQIGLFGQSWRDQEAEHMRRDLVQLRSFAYTMVNEDMS